MLDYRYLILLTLLLPQATACVVSQPDSPQPFRITKSGDSVDLSDSPAVSVKLLSQYVLWEGIPYREGGLSRKGIDCSGLVQLTFRSKFGYDIPRTTGSQVEIGRKVSRDALRPGDLLFFKTGFFSRHVGIYLGDSKFLHASTSRGVMLSSLNEHYWRKHYWTAKRLDSL